MSKYFIFLILLTVGLVQSIHAEPKTSKIEITAKYIEATQTSIHARGNVIVYYADSVIKADEAHYNKVKKLLELDGNIEMIGYDSSKKHSNHIKIYTEKNEIIFNDLFFVGKNDVWLFSDYAHKKEGNFTFGTSVLSSCDVEDPLWKMVFSRSHYDTNASYMQIYDAKIYFWDVPVLYTPYLAFTTQNERSSGLLFPTFGYFSNEGLIYEQPIFWAISPSMDLEVNPQLRTTRSLGVYGTLRFVDSPHSSGEIRAGYFKSKQSFLDDSNILGDRHYGVEFNYDSSKVFTDLSSYGFRDGLYINSIYLNDIDYLNLQSNNLEHFGLVHLQESRLNYYVTDNEYYLGVNAKYFIDTTKVDNSDTMQVLPSTQIHKYLQHLIWDNLIYSADLLVNNLHREKGATLRQVEVNIPVEFNISFFDDFLNISLSEELYYSKFFFGNDNFAHDDFVYYSNIHRAKIFTDLSKKYDTFVHVMQPSIQYIRPGNEEESPVEASLLSDEQKKLFTVGLPEEVYNFAFSQYFYDEKMNLQFFQRFTQQYYPQREFQLADMNNEMQYNLGEWRFYNNLVYAHAFNELRESSSTVALAKTDYSFTAGHTYTQTLPDLPLSVAANDVYLTFAYTYSEKIRLNGGVTYNLDESASRQWRFGGSYNRDCWSIAASVRQDITPRSTGFTTDNTFFVQLNFIPFGSIGTENLDP